MKTNILFIVLDCARADVICGPRRHVKTPVIDSLVERGTYFTQAISTASTTTPCFASLLTGTYPFTNGVRGHSGCRLKADITTLAESLRAAGYHTYAEMSGPLLPEVGLARGFDEYNHRSRHECLGGEWGEAWRQRLRTGGYKEPLFILLHVWSLHRPRQVLPQFDSPEYGREEYERAVSSVDWQLGRILELFDQPPLLILHSDHGENVPRGLWGWFSRRFRHRLERRVNMRFYHLGHGFNVYDSLVRVPLLFVGEPFPAGRVATNQVRQIDILPTLLDALGIPAPVVIKGRSLMPAVRGEAMESAPAYMEACGSIIPSKDLYLAGLRTPDWKYIYAPYTDTIRPALYNLKLDPAELVNLAPLLPGLARQMGARIEAIRAGDTYTLDTQPMTPEEQKRMEDHLRDLGYL
jgi:arylsulfatase A-like enzyme